MFFLDYEELIKRETQRIEGYAREHNLPLEAVELVEQSKYKSSDKVLITYGLLTCSAIAFNYRGINFMTHFCTEKPEEICAWIKSSLPEEAFKGQELKVHLWHGAVGVGSMRTCLNVMNELGLLYSMVNFGMLQTVLSNRTDKNVQTVKALQELQPSALIDVLIDVSASLFSTFFSADTSLHIKFLNNHATIYSYYCNDDIASTLEAKPLQLAPSADKAPSSPSFWSLTETERGASEPTNAAKASCDEPSTIKAALGN